MKLFYSIVNISLVVLACIAGIICSIYLYFHYFVKDFTVGVNNIGNQIEIVKAIESGIKDVDRNTFLIIKITIPTIVAIKDIYTIS